MFLRLQYAFLSIDAAADEEEADAQRRRGDNPRDGVTDHQHGAGAVQGEDGGAPHKT